MGEERAAKNLKKQPMRPAVIAKFRGIGGRGMSTAGFPRNPPNKVGNGGVRPVNEKPVMMWGEGKNVIQFITTGTKERQKKRKRQPAGVQT